MTGPEHYKEAERLLTQHNPAEWEALTISRAKAHATLALAAATALSDSAMGMPTADDNEWHAVASSEVTVEITEDPF
jgi:hypothetical protein